MNQKKVMNRMAATIYLNDEKTVYKIGSSDYAISCAPLAFPGPHFAKHHSESWVCAVATAVPNGMVYRYEVETIETYSTN